MRLFIYGSLMDRDVLQVVLGRQVGDHERRTAYLDGYLRARVDEEHYPVLVPRPGSVVEGMLFTPADDADMDRIDFFEGLEYAFAPVTVRLPDGSEVAANVCAGDPDDLATEESWSLAHWRATAKPAFLEMARAYMAWYGYVDPDDAEDIWEEKKAELEGLADLSRGHLDSNREGGEARPEAG